MKNNKNDNKTFYSLKFIIIGNQSVGKTNIINRFVKGVFINKYMITIGLDYSTQNIKIDNTIFKLQLWDTAGSERFRSVTKGYFSNSVCALIVYDITDEKSFSSIKNWIEECKSYTNENILLVLIGNKNDLKEQRVITKEQGQSLAEEYGMQFYESSALTGENINEIFYESCKIINKNINNKIYDLNDPSNGIKADILKNEDEMTIDKSISANSNTKILDNNKLSNKKSNCKC